MRTFIVDRPTEDHIKEMVEKANKVNLKQIDILLQNGYTILFSSSKRKYNREFKVIESKTK